MKEFGTEDRMKQLQELAAVCRRLTDAFLAHGDDFGHLFAQLGHRADALRQGGFSQADLTNLARDFPADPDWLNPKALDAGLPLQPSQAWIATDFRLARRLALDLRTLATY